jgi:hypothetical protein
VRPAIDPGSIEAIDQPGAANMSITVTLDTSANPPVTCNPDVTVKERGDDTITWKPASGSTFTFCGLEIQGECFTNLNLSDDKITIKDHNHTSTSSGDWAYTVYVRSADGTTFYSSQSDGLPGGPSDPMIQNK